MSELIYNKTNWKDDETTPINARNLNNLEDGIEYIYHKWDDIISDATTGDHAAELIDARNGIGGTNKTLGQRLNKIDEQFNTIESEKADKTITNNLQGQINTLVVNGTGNSNPEVVQSRVSSDGYIFNLLKDKEDFEMNKLIYPTESYTTGTSVYQTVSNGATYSNQVLTIPSGSLGGGSYLGYIITIKKEWAGKELIIELDYSTSESLTGKFELRTSNTLTGVTISYLNYNNLNKPFIKISVSKDFNVDNTIRMWLVCLNYSTPFQNSVTLTLNGYKIYNYNTLLKLKDDIETRITQETYTLNAKIDIANSVSENYLVNKYTMNWFDKSKAHLDGYYDKNGAFNKNNSYVIGSGFIPIIQGEYVGINRLENSQPIFTFWDSNKIFISSKLNIGYGTIADMSNVAYVNLTFFPSEIDTLMITKAKLNDAIGNFATGLRYFPYNKPLVSLKTHWYGKHFATIGDSLTQMEYWQPHVATMLGMTYTKYAQSGGNMVSIANFINNVIEIPDLFTVWAGTNDWYNNIVLGDFLTTDDTTYSGALNKLIKKISTDFKKTKLLIITPMQRDDMTPTQNKNDKGYWLNTNNNSLEDFANMCIKYCDYYGIELLDMFHRSGVNPMNISNYSNDKLHPNVIGFENLAHGKIIPKIKSM